MEEKQPNTCSVCKKVNATPVGEISWPTTEKPPDRSLLEGKAYRTWKKSHHKMSFVNKLKGLKSKWMKWCHRCCELYCQQCREVRGSRTTRNKKNDEMQCWRIGVPDSTTWHKQWESQYETKGSSKPHEDSGAHLAAVQTLQRRNEMKTATQAVVQKQEKRTKSTTLIDTTIIQDLNFFLQRGLPPHHISSEVSHPQS